MLMPGPTPCKRFARPLPPAPRLFRIASGVISLALLLLASVVASRAAAQEADLPQGPYQVVIADSVVLGAGTNHRPVLVAVHYPVGAGRFPLIVFSHALRANRHAFRFVSEYWASHGYVVVHPEHDDRGVAMTPSGMHPAADRVLARVGDVTAVLDGLDELESRVIDPRGVIDRTHVGISGHSYGSIIAMLVAGVRADIGTETSKDVRDGRAGCLLAVAPSGRGDYGLTDTSWTGLRIPSLIINGSADVRSGHPAEWRWEPYELAPAGDKHHVVIAKATHNEFGGDTSGSDVPRYVERASLAFWDHCLKGSKPAGEFLDRAEGFRRWAGAGATISSK